jgi:glutathione S-transferase
MRLYYAPGACSLASYISLLETGLPFKSTSVNLKTGQTADGADFKRINPKGYVPALLIGDRELLTENVAVLLYIADLKPSASLAPAAGTLGRARLVEWLAFINCEMHKTASPVFKPDAPEQAKTYARELLRKRTEWLSGALGSNSFLCGQHFTVADAYLFTVLSWFGSIGLDLADWPNLREYYNRIARRPAVVAAHEAEGLNS